MYVISHHKQYVILLLGLSTFIAEIGFARGLYFDDDDDGFILSLGENTIA
jgi:hypothetical protein